MSQRWLFFAATLIAAVGALNWSTVEFFEYNLLIDLLNLDAGTTEYQAVVAFIGLAAILAVYWELLWLGVIDDDMGGQ